MKKKEIIQELKIANLAYKASLQYGTCPHEYTEEYVEGTRKYGGLRPEYVAREMSEIISLFKDKIFYL